MESLKEILEKLPQSDRELLNYAFEHGLAQFVRLPNNRFIGVNIDHLTYLIPDAIAGKWRAGKDTSGNHKV